MTKDEVKAIMTKADSGDLDAMKKAASIFMEIAEQHEKAGRLEQSLICLSKSKEYSDKVKARDPRW